MMVGDYFLTSEMSRTNRIVYYIVKLVEMGTENAAKCEWYTFRDESKLFVKLEAHWDVQKQNLIQKLEKPILVGRRGKMLFKEVYKFLISHDYEA